jgi:tetratricopeptide (TPR) repeat protein
MFNFSLLLLHHLQFLTWVFYSRPGFAAAWMNLGIVEAELKKYSQAEDSYKTAIQHRHNYPDCYYNLGNLVNYFCHTDNFEIFIHHYV